jgi:hypothetical protein
MALFRGDATTDLQGKMVLTIFDRESSAIFILTAVWGRQLNEEPE